MAQAFAFYQGATQFAAGAVDARGIRMRAETEKRLNDVNARLADGQAEDAQTIGDLRASAAVREKKQALGKQRVALAANGNLDSGTASDILAETNAVGANEEMTIRNNAAMEAWGYKTQALNTRMTGQMKYDAAQSTAFSTLLGGGLKAAETFGGSVYKKVATKSAKQ